MGSLTHLCLVLLLQHVSAATVYMYVGPHGSDSNSGASHGNAFLTLEKAKLKAVHETEVKGNSVIVELLPGYHDLKSTLQFSNGHKHRVTFRAYKSQEVHVTGGKRISSSLFHHVTVHRELQRLPHVARNKVVKVHLPDAGITDYGQMTRYGFGIVRTAPLELFINGRPTRFAQWPNEGYINVESVPDGKDGARFTYSVPDNRDLKWAHEKQPWVYGFWYWGWADDAVKVTNFDVQNKIITLAQPVRFGLRQGFLPNIGGFSKQGGYFRVINMLSELDEPGEYYIDRTTGDLYVWPNTPSGTLSHSDIVYASLINTCFSIASGVYNLVFSNFTVEACRHHGFSATDIHNVKFINMEIKNSGANGISCRGDCRSITVSKCEIHHVDGGIHISGGRRATLTPSGNLIEDNHIWQYSRVAAVDHFGIGCFGVHNMIRHNELHDGQYTAIWWAGNDHVIEYNHVWNNCVNSSDCGAIHAGRDWTNRGNVIRYNHIHHTLRFWPGSHVRGIMLDDQYSSVTIEHNVFYHNEIHVNIGGGRDNIVRYNVFYNATGSSIHVDGRGLPNGNGNNGTLETRLKAVPYTNKLWQEKYPKLAVIDQTNANAPEGNKIYDNVYYNEHGKQFNPISESLNTINYFDVHDNFKSPSPTDFWSPENNDFRLRCLAGDWANTLNFAQPVDLNSVGPRYQTGPAYLNIDRYEKSHHSATPKPCAGTQAPATKAPKTPYLSDGSGPNNIHPDIPKYGCWFITTGCPHDEYSGLVRDKYGEEHVNAGRDEDACLARAADEWRYCGSPSDHTVTTVFGPTGAMTLAGSGCYFADYGCPKYHIYHPKGAFYHDHYGEQHGALSDENTCLSRARDEWVYCGSDPNFPITSLYAPTGKSKSAGGGCWIKIKNCPGDSKLQHTFFYDAWGATNLDTDHDQNVCFERGRYFWHKCGSHDNYPVSAYFRPTASSRTSPSH